MSAEGSPPDDDHRTRFRPIPRPGGKGGGAAGPAGAGGGAGPASAPGMSAAGPASAGMAGVAGMGPASSAADAAARLPAGPGAAAALASFEAGGANRLVDAAAALLALIARLRSTVTSPNVAQLRQQAVREIRALDARLLALGYAQDVQIPARYVLCTAVDQAVFNTPWGPESGWSQEGLLVSFHRENWGGEKFFEILDRARRDPRHYIDLLELQYICLMLGFAGRYQNEPDGARALGDLQHELYRTIRDVRGAPPAALADHWEGHREPTRRLFRYLPVWVAAAATVAIVFLVWLYDDWRLTAQAAPVKDELARIGVEPVVYQSTAPPPASSAATLERLLAPEIAAHRVTVEETPAGALVSLTAPDLFASGSAALNPAEADTLRHVGEALNQVPGRVVVIGHTDDQPLRSFRYADNLELSRERAQSVKRLLEPLLGDPARLSAAGVGATQPRYVPPSLPENRARNRRVEVQLKSS